MKNPRFPISDIRLAALAALLAVATTACAQTNLSAYRPLMVNTGSQLVATPTGFIASNRFMVSTNFFISFTTNATYWEPTNFTLYVQNVFTSYIPRAGLTLAGGTANSWSPSNNTLTINTNFLASDNTTHTLGKVLTNGNNAGQASATNFALLNVETVQLGGIAWFATTNTVILTGTLGEQTNDFRGVYTWATTNYTSTNGCQMNYVVEPDGGEEGGTITNWYLINQEAQRYRTPITNFPVTWAAYDEIDGVPVGTYLYTNSAAATLTAGVLSNLIAGGGGGGSLTPSTNYILRASDRWVAHEFPTNPLAMGVASHSSTSVVQHQALKTLQTQQMTRTVSLTFTRTSAETNGWIGFAFPYVAQTNIVTNTLQLLVSGASQVAHTVSFTTSGFYTVASGTLTNAFAVDARFTGFASSPGSTNYGVAFPPDIYGAAQ